MNSPYDQIRTNQDCIKHYNNYELYITVGEEEDFLLVIDTSNNETPADTTDGVKDDVLEAVAHFIMMHYAEKVNMKKKKKKKKEV